MIVYKKDLTNKTYADLAIYCNENDCHIEDKGDYLESVPNEHPAPTHDEIRQMREFRFEQEADPIRYAYDEALARGEETAETLKQEWLAKKDEIRADLPYPDVV